jgi:hypothetical protein
MADNKALDDNAAPLSGSVVVIGTPVDSVSMLLLWLFDAACVSFHVLPLIVSLLKSALMLPPTCRHITASVQVVHIPLHAGVAKYCTHVDARRPFCKEGRTSG